MLTFNFRVRDSRIGQKKTEDYTLVQFQSIFFNLHDPHFRDGTVLYESAHSCTVRSRQQQFLLSNCSLYSYTLPFSCSTIILNTV